MSQPPDLPNPNLGQPYSVDLRTWLNSGQFALSANLPPPPAAWYNPNPWSAFPVVDQKTWINPGGQANYVGKDIFFGLAGKAPNFDWPNPVGHDLRSRAWPSIDLKTLINQLGQVGTPIVISSQRI